MSKVQEMHDTIMRLTAKLEEETDRGQRADYITALSEAIQRLSSGYQMLRETEIHEEFHRHGGQLPGEGGPIDDGGLI